MLKTHYHHYLVPFVQDSCRVTSWQDGAWTVVLCAVFCD